MPTADDLRGLATLNLLYYPQGDRWRERGPLVEAQLRELAPDVIGLQEVNRSIDQDTALAARPSRSSTTGSSGRPRRSGLGTRVTGTAWSCSSGVRPAR